MKKLAIAAAFLGILAQQAIAAGKPTQSECVGMGIQYYKEIGSFPKLSTGEDAVEKVIAMCARSPIAFGLKD